MGDSTVWVVHAPTSIAPVVEKESVVAIGWSQMGDLSGCSDREAVKKRYRETYADDSEPKVAAGAGMLHRFMHVMNSDDLVLTPVKTTREVLIGRITGAHRFEPSLVSDKYPNVRPVKWLKKVSRDDLSQSLRFAIGGTLTVFRVSGYYAPEVRALLQGIVPTPIEPSDVEPEDSPALLYDDVKSKADNLISDMLMNVGPYEFQDLVAAVVRTLGFRTRVSPKGKDGGVDIVAHRDAFGFEEPRIKVQVKHRKGQAGAQEVRAFAGVLKSADNGLFVSTGGFTADALKEPEKRERLSLLDGEAFVALMLENYDRIEPEYQALIPLKKVYLPASTSNLSSG